MLRNPGINGGNYSFGGKSRQSKSFICSNNPTEGRDEEFC
jgi:hypothetical protein